MSVPSRSHSRPSLEPVPPAPPTCCKHLVPTFNPFCLKHLESFLVLSLVDKPTAGQRASWELPGAGPAASPAGQPGAGPDSTRPQASECAPEQPRAGREAGGPEAPHPRRQEAPGLGTEFGGPPPSPSARRVRPRRGDQGRRCHRVPPKVDGARARLGINPGLDRLRAGESEPAAREEHGVPGDACLGGEPRKGSGGPEGAASTRGTSRSRREPCSGLRVKPRRLHTTRTRGDATTQVTHPDPSRPGNSCAAGDAGDATEPPPGRRGPK